MEHNYTIKKMAEKLGVAPNTIRTRLRTLGLLKQKETLFQAYDRLYEEQIPKINSKPITYGTLEQIRNREVFEFFKSQYEYLLSKGKDKNPDRRYKAKLSARRRFLLIEIMNTRFPDKAPFLKDTIDKMIKKIKEGR
jgi:transcriptional regulator with XRE-family HTH domain